MADVPKVSVDREEIVSDLQKKLKGTIDMKLKEKDWTEDKKEEFKGKIFKLYKETVELALRENLVVKHKNKSSVVHQEMEPVNEERAHKVNKICAEAEDFLTCTIKKRKHYPQKVKELLQKRHDAEMHDLCVNTSERDMVENNVQMDNLGESSAVKLEQPDMTEYESYLTKFKKDSENLVLLSKSLAESKDKGQRLQTATEIHLRMQDNDVYKALIGKRKLPSTFDSIVATPLKENANDSLTESELTVTSTSEPLLCKITFPLKKLRELSSKDSANPT